MAVACAQVKVFLVIAVKVTPAAGKKSVFEREPAQCCCIRWSVRGIIDLDSGQSFFLQGRDERFQILIAQLILKRMRKDRQAAEFHEITDCVVRGYLFSGDIIGPDNRLLSKDGTSSDCGNTWSREILSTCPRTLCSYSQ